MEVDRRVDRHRAAEHVPATFARHLDSLKSHVPERPVHDSLDFAGVAVEFDLVVLEADALGGDRDGQALHLVSEVEDLVTDHKNEFFGVEDLTTDFHLLDLLKHLVLLEEHRAAE